jgi:hypothetical protein
MVGTWKPRRVQLRLLGSSLDIPHLACSRHAGVTSWAGFSPDGSYSRKETPGTDWVSTVIIDHQKLAAERLVKPAAPRTSMIVPAHRELTSG